MLELGRNSHFGDQFYPDWEVDTVYLTQEARKQGTYILGTTGTGKSTLLLNMILQDIHQGGGVCVLDPHGDFTSDILLRIPESREEDVILFDPSDRDKPFGLNLLDCNRDDPRERDLVVSTLVDTLQKLFSYSWGPRMEDLLRHGILSLLHHNEPTTLVHLMMLMVSYDKRRELTRRAKDQDPILRFYWEDEFPESVLTPSGTRRKPREQVELVSSSLNKIGRFITNPIIRHIVGQPHSTINMREVMDEGKILLVNLSQGDLGLDNAALLGAVLVNQILIAALSRRNVPEANRRLFHLYVDEYQTFATKTFPQLQSEARKYAITTTVAHQYRDQLDLENQGSTLNVANLISLRMSGRDAEEIAPQFDLTPEPGEVKFEPIVAPVDQDHDVFFQYQTEGSGANLYRKGESRERPYSDTKLETANLLAQLPNYQAICRVLSRGSVPKRLHQFRIELADKPGDVNQRRAEAIRQRSRAMAAFTEAEIRAYIEGYTSTEGTEDGYIPIMDMK